MPVGNLRTAANNDQDDDPRALRPIPIATKDMVSFVEKNNNTAGQNAEVVRSCFFVFPNVSIWSSRMMMMRAHFFWFWPSLLLSEKGIKREKCALNRVLVFRLRISFSLSRKRLDIVNQSDLNRWSRCFVLWMRLNQRDDYEHQRDDKDTRRSSDREKTKECASFTFLCTHLTALLLLSNNIHRERINWGKRNDRTTKWNWRLGKRPRRTRTRITFYKYSKRTNDQLVTIFRKI